MNEEKSFLLAHKIKVLNRKFTRKACIHKRDRDNLKQYQYPRKSVDQVRHIPRCHGFDCLFSQSENIKNKDMFDH